MRTYHGRSADWGNGRTPGLDAALDDARSGDVLVVRRLDRLSRSLKDLIEMVSLLESKGIGLKSLHDPHR